MIAERIIRAVVIVGLLSFVGIIGYVIWYSANDPGHGTITGKEHRPAYMSCSARTGLCTSYPECYDIKYSDGRNDGDACVTPAEYERYEVGGYYPAGR